MVLEAPIYYSRFLPLDLQSLKESLPGPLRKSLPASGLDPRAVADGLGETCSQREGEGMLGGLGGLREEPKAHLLDIFNS